MQTDRDSLHGPAVALQDHPERLNQGGRGVSHQGVPPRVYSRALAEYRYLRFSVRVLTSARALGVYAGALLRRLPLPST
jgi:hypothetical protein